MYLHFQKIYEDIDEDRVKIGDRYPAFFSSPQVFSFPILTLESAPCETPSYDDDLDSQAQLGNQEQSKRYS